jgi:hypothetical protein
MRVRSRRKVGRKVVGGVVEVGGEALLARCPMSRSDAGASYAASRHVEIMRVD